MRVSHTPRPLPSPHPVPAHRRRRISAGSFVVTLFQILSGTPFYRIDGYESLYVVDIENEPPYVQLELYKYREYQNWEDFLIEGSPWTPGVVG